MTPRTIGVLLLKLWGLVSLVNGLTGLLGAVASRFAPVTDPGMSRYVLLTTALVAVVNLAIGTALLLGANRLVAIIAPGEDTSGGVVHRYEAAEIQSLLFGALGVFFAVSAIRDITALLYTIARLPAWDSTGQLAYLLQNRQEQLAGALAQLVAAIVLLLVSRSALSSWWSRTRTVSTPSEG